MQQDRLTDLWKKYDLGRAFNNSLTPNQYSLVHTNIDFFTGNQWVNLPDTEAMRSLPKPTFNIIKRVVSLFVASLTSQNANIYFSPLDNTGQIPAEFATREVNNLTEKFKLDYRIRDALYDGAITGDYCAHFFWVPYAEPYGGTLSANRGEIRMELVDGVNVLFGNPNICDVERQPYIILVGRDWDPEESPRGVTHSLDEKDKGLYVLLYEKINGTVHASKATKENVIFDRVNTGLKRYPVAWGNWEKQKNSYHGRALVTGIVPNQIYINTMMAMVFRNMMTQSFNKIIYNADLLPVWNNEIGQAIGIHNLPPGYDLNQVATTMKPGDISEQIIYSIDKAMEYTKECLGATDVQLGNVTPDNTSALILLQNSSSVPLGNIRAGVHEWVEDIGAILLDLIGTYYGTRPVAGESGISEQFDFSVFRSLWFKVRADIGPMNLNQYYSTQEGVSNVEQTE